MIELKDKKMSNERDLKGLKGWLILVGIGLVVSPIRLLIQLIPMYSEFAQGGGLGCFNYTRISPVSPAMGTSDFWGNDY